MIIFFFQLISAFGTTTVCKSDNSTCYTIEEEYGAKNQLLAVYYGGIIGFWLLVWLTIKDYKLKGKIWESPINFFITYTKLMSWFWIIMIIGFFWLRLVFASHTDDYFNQVINWWQIFQGITLFPYTFFAIYFVYRKILQLPQFKNIYNEVKEWWK